MDKSATTIIALVFLAALAAILWFAYRNLRGTIDTVRTAIDARRGGNDSPAPVAANRLSRINPDRDIPGDSVDPEPMPEPAPELDAESRAFASALVAGLSAQIGHETDLEDLRGSQPCVIRLVPQIPIRDVGTAQSWLGGRPRIPAGIDWPRGDDGAPLDFIAQIGCEGLPADLWDGMGPRSGWLAYFVHPESGAPSLFHWARDGEPHDPPHAISDLYFSHHFAKADQGVPLPRRAFPEWPVDMVVVRPGDRDPMPDPETAPLADAHSRYTAGYDLTDPSMHPFDWPSMLALASILEGKSDFFWRDRPDGPSPLDTQLENARTRLDEGERAPERPANLDALRNQVDVLPRLIEATDAARETNRAAKAMVTEIVAAIRESHDAGEDFSPRDAAAVLDALSGFEWTKVNRKADPDKRPGMELIEVKTLPLTRHDPDASLWVHDYAMCHEDMAKHAYCADPAALPDAVRTHYEGDWQRAMLEGMAGIGHIPFQYVHDFDAARDVMLLERPTCYLLNFIVGDCHNMVLTMTKDDLAAARWDALVHQVSN